MSYGGGSSSYNYRDNARLQEQCQAKQKAIEDSTTESLRLVQESLNTGAATAEELHRQGEVIDRTHEKLVDINNKVKQSEHHVRGMKSLFGGLMNKIRGPPKEKSVTPEKEVVVPNSTKARAPAAPSSSSYAEPERHHLDTDRTHDNLVQIGVGVRGLREMALSMGAELDRQNAKLGDVQDEANKANLGVGRVNKDMQKILNS